MRTEAHREFDCFGGTATIHVRAGARSDGEEAAGAARSLLLEAHRRLSRFEPESELTRLNEDPRWEVPASPLMLATAAVVAEAGSRSGGLVDATLVDAIERAGYGSSLDGDPPITLAAALAGRDGRSAAQPHPDRLWRAIGVDEARATVIRPPGIRIDSGGIAKGLLADLVGERLRDSLAYAVDCCGDIRIGGKAGLARRVLVDDPFGAGPLHELNVRDGAVATSGIGRRCWIDATGVAHHILDPSSGEPAFTGIVQATALAPSAYLAEVYAKSALLAGPEQVEDRLPHGGVVVRDDRSVQLVDARRTPEGSAVAA